VNSLPSAPVAVNASRCGAGVVTIGATPGVGQTVDWYTLATLGSLLQAGSTSYTTPSITATKSYFALARDTTTTCVSATRTAVVATISTVPAVPTAVLSPVSVCNNVFNGTDTTFSINRVTGVNGATSYNWSVSNSSTMIISGHVSTGANDTAITVHFTTGFVSGNVLVSGVNSCGAGTAKTFTVAKNVPATPVITGSSTGCPGGQQTYTAYSPTGTSYTWTVPTTVGTFTGQGTSSITITFKTSFVGSGAISVKTTSVCGTSAASPNFTISSSCVNGRTVPVASSVSGKTDVSIYPNPNNGNFAIAINGGSPLNSDAAIDIIDGMGRSVYHTVSKNSGGLINLHVANELASGIYQVHCVINGQVVTRKLVINR
jgi:hypothetical protein